MSDELPAVIEGTVVRGGRVGPQPGGTRKFDELKKTTYVRLLRQGVRRYKAAEIVGVSYPTVWTHLKSDPAFAEAVSQAEMAKLDEVEEALYETALAGNVTAQQVVLYNRRPDEWADQRMLKAKLEAAEVERAAAAEKAGPVAVEGLRSKLLELRERLIVPEPTEVAVEVERVDEG